MTMIDWSALKREDAQRFKVQLWSHILTLEDELTVEDSIRELLRLRKMARMIDNEEID